MFSHTLSDTSLPRLGQIVLCVLAQDLLCLSCHVALVYQQGAETSDFFRLELSQYQMFII